MSQFKITKNGIEGNLIGNASTTTAISSSGQNGQVWGMSSSTTQGWINQSGGSGSEIIIRTY